MDKMSRDQVGIINSKVSTSDEDYQKISNNAANLLDTYLTENGKELSNMVSTREMTGIAKYSSPGSIYRAGAVFMQAIDDATKL